MQYAVNYSGFYPLQIKITQFPDEFCHDILHSRKLGLTLVMQMSYLCANYNSTRNQVDEEPLCGRATPKIIIYLFIYLSERL